MREALAASFEIDVPVVMVSEAGASVYSASDVGARGVPRARRHRARRHLDRAPAAGSAGRAGEDRSQEHRRRAVPARRVAARGSKKSLDAVVDSCVNQVGVNLNTASTHLLAHVSGIGPALARAIVEHRAKARAVQSRDGSCWRCRASRRRRSSRRRASCASAAARTRSTTPACTPSATRSLERLARQLGVGDRGARWARGVEQREGGDATFTRRGRRVHLRRHRARAGEAGPRSARRRSCRSRSATTSTSSRTCSPGWCCPGIVTNVTNFGAFVDIGVHQDGLVHISQLADKFVKDPREVVNAGDRVSVRVLEVKLDKKQIALTMKSGSASESRAERPAAASRPADDGRRPPRDRGCATAAAAAAQARAVQQPVRRRARESGQTLVAQRVGERPHAPLNES